jgi:DNA-binding FadR family transcriptional regulator
MSVVKLAKPRRQLRQPRVAEMVASVLRERILDGTLPDGSGLPKQEELLEEFPVSLPSMREALSILQTEGLVTVQRGNVGGAMVHAPTPTQTSYMAALVLQSRSVVIEDVARALSRLDPVCAAACAERSDRRRTIVPVLRQNISLSEAALDQPERYVRLARTFHEELVAGCGNESIRLMVGALESIWSVHTQRYASEPSQQGPYGDRSGRERSLGEHRAIFDSIVSGDARTAEEMAREHLTTREPRHVLAGSNVVVHADLLRQPVALGRPGSLAQRLP